MVPVGATRSDVAPALWAIPWQILLGLGQGVACAFSWLSLVGLVRRLRYILGVVVAVQSWVEGTTVLRTAVAVVAVNYLLPRWESGGRPPCVTSETSR
ncbi:hypothetical protein BA895_22545 [Humibacillus sp. DSM 29435]|nr:hypothetical protein BA895_22545 [Humibacillus sp. DSM 29435]